MPYRHSFFLRGLLITAFAVAAPLMALQAYTLFAERQGDLRATQQSVASRIEQTARNGDATLERIQQVLVFLASRPELRSADRTGCTTLLKNITLIDPLLANVGAVDLQGSPLCRAIDGPTAYANYANVAWFKEAAGATGPFLSSPYYGEISRKWLINVVYPLQDSDGRRIGLLAAAIDLNALSDRLLRDDGLPPGTLLGLVGHDATVLAINHDRDQWVGRTLPPELFEAVQAATHEPREIKGIDGAQRVMASSRLQRFPVFVGISVPRDVVMAPSESRARQSALIALLVAVGALALASIGARRLSRPVLSLADTARRFGQGDMQARADERWPAEFRLLAQEFNKAIEAFRASDEARRARVAAEAASQAKGEFLAHMSHEIRTPMNAVLGLTDLALREALPPKVRDHLARVKLSAQNLMGILNEILDLSKIEAGKLQIEQVEFPLQEVIDRVAAMMGLLAQKKGLELLISMAPDVPQAVVGDPLRLEQVLVNLCNNAVKFTQQGEIVLAVACESGGRLRFAVRDTGPGMTADQVSRLFKPFSQLDASTTRQHGGTGLGLAICKQLVELMGGQIDVRSRPGVGSEFFFTVQVGQARAQVPAAGRPRPSLAGCRVLVVDDSQAAREILAQELTELEARFDLAEDGRAALALLRESIDPFDVALVDLMLPDTDGFSLIRQMRALEPENRTRYLLVTIFGNEHVARQAQVEVLDGCLFKPISRQALATAIQRARGVGPALPAGTEIDPLRAPAGLRGARVLLVEDNDFNQIVAGELLGSVAGMQVVVASDGPQALQWLESTVFDLVLMDVQMPGMDGFEATRRIRATASGQSLPIIAMTAHAMARDRQKCLDAGMNDFIAKPLEPAEVFAVLARWLKGTAFDAGASAVDAPMHAGQRVDFSEGLRRCMERKDLYDRIAQRFVSSRADDARRMLEASQGGDRAFIAKLAHTTISTAGTLGARPLCEQAKALQAALDAAVDDPGLARLVSDFAAEHERVQAELRDYLAS